MFAKPAAHRWSLTLKWEVSTCNTRNLFFAIKMDSDKSIHLRHSSMDTSHTRIFPARDRKVRPRGSVQSRCLLSHRVDVVRLLHQAIFLRSGHNCKVERKEKSRRLFETDLRIYERRHRLPVTLSLSLSFFWGGGKDERMSGMGW